MAIRASSGKTIGRKKEYLEKVGTSSTIMDPKIKNTIVKKATKSNTHY